MPKQKPAGAGVKHRIRRPAFNLNAVAIIRSIPVAEIPPAAFLSRTRPGKRRWEDLGDAIRESSQRGEALVVHLEAGYTSDTMRTGVSSELKRFHLRMRVRTVLEEDGSHTLYFQAI